MGYELRGKCKELSEKFANDNAEYIVVSGFYYEPLWTGKEKQEHFWCKNKITGEIYDPTASQFPSGGIEEFYTEFDGTFECSQCGKEKDKDEMIHEGAYHLCDGVCYCRFVGIPPTPAKPEGE